MTTLRLEYTDNDTLHDDLVLHFAGARWVGDSYYLALDNKLLPKEEDAPKIRCVLRRLLEQWLEAIAQMPIHGTRYLAFDFQDQGTGWLRCISTPEGFLVCVGYSSLEGWAISPSDLGAAMLQRNDFRPYSSEVEMSQAQLREAIEQSLSKAL